MRFEIITIFPDIFSAKGKTAFDGEPYGYFGASIISRAQKKGLIKINVHNLRDFAQNKHKTVDDKPYGGGPGMVMKVEPIYKCVENIKSKIKSQKSNKSYRIILFSAKGKKYTQADARRLSKYGSLVLICGRYEGVDERVAKYVADEEISIGDYVLTGGEIPAMILVDSITRLLPGVLGNEESANFDSHGKSGYLEHPQYTKPEIFMGWKTPKVLLSGDHKKIEDWRGKNSKTKE